MTLWWRRAASGRVAEKSAEVTKIGEHSQQIWLTCRQGLGILIGSQDGGCPAGVQPNEVR